MNRTTPNVDSNGPCFERGVVSRRYDGGGDGSAGWPSWWRICVVALATLIMCSCQAQNVARHSIDGADPCVACAAMANESAMCPPGGTCPDDGACVRCAARPDEYLCDGGDRDASVGVFVGGEIAGLDQEDTVAHFVTVDGRQVVEPSSKVCIYAPRFAAVRKVQTAIGDEQVQQPLGVDRTLELARAVEAQTALDSTQHVRLGRHFSSNKSQGVDTRASDGGLSTVVGPLGFDNAFMPYEDLTVIRTGRFNATERSLLVDAAAAAVAWTHEQAVQLIVDEKAAAAAVKDEPVQVTYTVDDLAGPAHIRVIKIASTDAAQPGDVVDFTVRLDNLGGKPVGNVTLVDNLSTRLEYVANSAQSSLKSKFTTSANQGGSLVLRWDFAEPLVPRDGSLVRFKCRVR